VKLEPVAEEYVRCAPTSLCGPPQIGEGEKEEEEEEEEVDVEAEEDKEEEKEEEAAEQHRCLKDTTWQ